MDGGWSSEHLALIEDVTSFSDLVPVAFSVLDSLSEPIGWACGPISTGGMGSIEKNLEYFNNVILKLSSEGKSMFSQMPLEVPMQKLKNQLELSFEEANLKLLEDFYLPLFESGRISTLYFISGWESSHGARWEHERAKELGIEIVYLSEDFLES